MFKKKLLLTTYVLLGLYLAFQVLNFTRLEFRTEQLSELVRNISFASLVILLTLIGVFTRSDFPASIKIFVMMLTIVVVTVCWIFDMLPFPHATKVRFDGQVLFVSRHNSNKRIIEQSYYSGLTGSNANYIVVETQNITKNVRWTKPVNLAIIDSSEWIKVASSSME